MADEAQATDQHARRIKLHRALYEWKDYGGPIEDVLEAIGDYVIGVLTAAPGVASGASIAGVSPSPAPLAPQPSEWAECHEHAVTFPMGGHCPACTLGAGLSGDVPEITEPKTPTGKLLGIEIEPPCSCGSAGGFDPLCWHHGLNGTKQGTRGESGE